MSVKAIFSACRQNTFGNSIELRIGARNDGRQMAVVEPLVFRAIAEGEYTTPALVITTEAAQQLMDELWACGLRPTEGAGSAGAMAATKAHLEDMRKIALTSFDLLAGQGLPPQQQQPERLYAAEKN